MVLTPLCALLASKLGITVNAEEVIGLVLPVVVYIVSHKFKTASLQKTAMQAGAAAPATPPAPGAGVNG